jgi:5-(hydroxymethyl)furfural/furfural oxidase
VASALEADWVVVGGGSAGCVVASRLSEDPSAQVILAEAGLDWRSADASPQIRSVNGWYALDQASSGQFQWKGIQARRTAVQAWLPLLRGKGLGGTSTINGMMALRATPADYNAWADGGASGWSFDEMLPYLRRMETDSDFGHRPYHGASGPMPVRRLPREEWGPIDDAFAESALGLGNGWCDDYGSPSATGVSPIAFNVRAGARVSTNDAYIDPVRDRANLTILGDATVDRVLISGSRAVGVRVRIKGESTQIHAKNIVLCAGAIHSPAILLRTGIGPAGPIAQLPVGEGLQDHPLAIFWLKWRPDARPKDMDSPQMACCLRYSSGLYDAGENDMYISVVRRSPKQPDHGAAPSAAGPDATGTWGVGVHRGSYEGGGSNDLGLMVVSANHAVSRGRLSLTSDNPDAAPRIESNMLAEDSDLHRMRDGVRRALELLHTPPLKSVIEQAAVNVEGEGVDALSDDASIDQWMMNSIGDAGHITGTCRLGAPEDSRSVVDPQGRVIGVEGLFVADASIFPTVPRANINFPTIAAAERLSDLIRANG